MNTVSVRSTESAAERFLKTQYDELHAALTQIGMVKLGIAPR